MDKKMKAKAIANLKKARKIVAKRGGWVSGSYDTGQQVCAIGAINRVVDYNDNCTPEVEAERAATIEQLTRALPACFFGSADAAAYSSLAEAIECIPLGGEGDIPSYNDAPGRTQRDVVALFDFAIQGKRMPSPSPRKGKN
jgi:hypothetical protein